MKRKLTFSALLILVCSVLCAQPVLERLPGSTARIVAGGEPMLMIGGELGNSSASVREDVHRHFAHLRSLGLNTVLAPVSWELIEPVEGEFDLGTVDFLLEEARANDLKLVILWFGAWKNSMSCYAPEWFKRDTVRFPRAHLADGSPVEEASSLSAGVLEADKKAFCRLLQHLRANDSEEQTVLMVQVENEIGMINEPRDCSPDATLLYNSKVPASLTGYLKKHRKSLHPYMAERFNPGAGRGTWPEVFGSDIYAEEIFQSWTYAAYVQQLASAGKAVYNIPMYVNVALNSRGRKPGQYPSGGPLAHLIDIWHAAAPAVDVLGVDIYDSGYADWTAKYHLPDNPLFIPEIRLEDRDAMYALYAFGHHGAMGFCPFSIEDYPLYAAGAGSGPAGDLDLSADDQLNAFSAKTSGLSPIAACYRLLRQAEPLILERQGTGDMDAVLLTDSLREQEITTPDGIGFTVRHSYSLGWEPGSKDPQWPEAACLVLRLGKDDYLVLGSGVVLTFSGSERGKIGIAKCESVAVEKDGGLRVIRHLNGDQTHQGRHIRIPAGQFDIQHFKLYRY